MGSLMGHLTGMRYKIQAAFGQGMSDEKVALSCTVGLLMGLMPLAWGSCVLCLLVGWQFKLNHPLIQLLNYALYPLQIALFVPFFYAGGWLFDQPQLFNRALLDRLMGNPLLFFDQLWQANLHALVTWAGVSVMLLPCVYVLSLATVRRWSRDRLGCIS